MIYVIFIVFALISFGVQKTLQNKFENYSKVPIPNGLTGKDIAEKMLHDNGIYNVTVTSVDGKLTDHYNPENHTVNLSHEVYHGNSVAAAAVAAHECGHGRATCYCLCVFEYEIQISSYCEFCVALGTMGAVGGYYIVAEFSAAYAFRDYLVRIDYIVQFCDASGRNKCECKSFSLA